MVSAFVTYPGNKGAGGYGCKKHPPTVKYVPYVLANRRDAGQRHPEEAGGQGQQGGESHNASASVWPTVSRPWFVRVLIRSPVRE